MAKPNTKSVKIKITGIVQGVGFRPHVYRLAQETRVRGWVLNSSEGVYIEAEGLEEQVSLFCRLLVENPPPLAVIKDCHIEEQRPKGYKEFVIKESRAEKYKTAMISPDIAVCQDCISEVSNPLDRRYGYPFTNCTNCGPRFTIIKDVPYDREKTTMASFPMCEECQKEFEDPSHRRFHAQPNACPKCGPQMQVVDPEGRVFEVKPVGILRAGKILAVKGLGGFHLAVDATNPDAVARLRERKKREAKPFAVMARDLDVVRKYCYVNEKEAFWLTSPQAPIVILKRKQEAFLPDDVIHPGISTMGVMLPYTPLHFLLFDRNIELLIMTSANIADEPLIIDNAEALEKLKDVADFFLVHNREIYNPCDDSVLRITACGDVQFYRRARGFVPRGLEVPLGSKPVLAVGGEIKNTFCLTRNNEAYLSQHLGDLNHYLNFQRFQEAVERFTRMIGVCPQVVAHDMHPNYQSTLWAKQQKDLHRVEVQHHHAHLASCMAENQLKGEVLGVICDGTGWGTDGAVWGMEVLQGGYEGFKRRGHLRYVPLAGGDATVKKPWRMAFIYLWDVFGEKALELADEWWAGFEQEERKILAMQLHKGINLVPTSSCGRLFDAVSAFLGVCYFNRYEGQAAIELEEKIDGLERGLYPYQLEKTGDCWIMDVRPMWKALVRDREKQMPERAMAARFHRTLVSMLLEVVARVGEETGIEGVVLSGGSFHNQFLLSELKQGLEELGFKVYHQTKVPPSDGGLALGQAVVAQALSSK